MGGIELKHIARSALTMAPLLLVAVVLLMVAPMDVAAHPPAPAFQAEQGGQGRAAGLAETDSAAREQEAEPEPEPEPEKTAEEKAFEAFQARTIELIADRNYEVRQSDHYMVRTDDPRVQVGEVSDLLESFWSFFDGFWPAGTTLHAQGRPAEFLLFYSRNKYNRLYEGTGIPSPRGSVGHHTPFLGLVAAHTDTVGPAELSGVLLHEAAHFLVRERLYGLDAAPVSRWVAEGLAGYFGFTRRGKSGEFEKGRIGGYAAPLLKGPALLRPRLPFDRLKEFRMLLKVAEPGFIDDLVQTNTQDLFYVEEIIERYTAAWLLVHYLLHGQEGSLVEPFIRYMGMEAEGKGGAEAFYQQIGMDAEALEAAFTLYVKKLKTR
jgi:hypothetical protein